MTGTNIQSPMPESSSVAASTPDALPVSPADIDLSCRMPVMFLFTSALVWLFLSNVLVWITSLKLPSPEFLSHTPWLTFGRLQPAYLNALVYGFGSQAALGAALWLLARLGRTTLYGSLLITTAGAFWNLGVTVGIVGILAGDSTGYEWLEIPGYASPILFVSYSLIGICAVMTFYFRRERPLYVSQWFLLAALLWFPWIYSTAQLLLVVFPARGILQAVINAWFAHNLIEFWLTAVGLAALFYFIPKLLDRPLYSCWLAFFGFWLFVLLVGWGGLWIGAPVPRWLSAVSTLASLMMIVPVMAAALNFYFTMKRQSKGLEQSSSGRFILLATVAYVINGVLSSVTTLRPLSQVLRFTQFTNALLHLGLFGFFAMAMFGSIYYIVPRLTLQNWPSEKLIQVHYWASAVGIVLYTVSLGIGGVVEGIALNDPKVPFLDVVARTRPFLAASSLAITVLLAGNTAFLINLGWTLARCCRTCCQSDDLVAPDMKPLSAGATR
jgi:cytochrome c oxidase cbb3-type subunit 1